MIVIGRNVAESVGIGTNRRKRKSRDNSAMGFWMLI